jgi:hypothetical protein
VKHSFYFLVKHVVKYFSLKKKSFTSTNVSLVPIPPIRTKRHLHSNSKFRVSGTEARQQPEDNFYGSFEFKNFTGVFLPETSYFSEFRVFKPKLFVLQRIFFVLPKIRVLIPGFL